MQVPWPEISDPGLSALKSATRAAIVMPAVFAVAYELIQQPQTALFASFGSFAMLVLANFGGPPMSRFTAYASLAIAGAVLVVVGTLCSRNAWLAAASMAVVGFTILLCGAINGYFAAGATAAILAFVLPVSIPATTAAIGWRLAGWGLAASVGLCAVMLAWPPRQDRTLRGEAAHACLALADLAEAVGSGDLQVATARVDTAAAGINGLRGRFQATPHRPTGPSGQAAALAALIDELGWLLVSLRAVATAPMAGLCWAENTEAMAAAAAVLRFSGELLAGMTGHHQPAEAWPSQADTARLERAEDAVARALARRISQLPPVPDEASLDALLGQSFRTRAISYTTLQIAGYALAAGDTGRAAADGSLGRGSQAAQRPSGSRPPGVASWLAPRPTVLRAVRNFAAEHATARSVVFRNAVRGAAGLAVAVFIAQRSGLQHSFWVVLGTLSVLRSNALGTGRSVLGALAGTAAGIVVGAAILLAVGTNDPVLWAVLPVAVLVAAYAPRVVSFAAGQAAFTVVLLVLFNIIQPAGWQVGLIRIEDVAIGFAVSLGVGLVFWPRGAASVLRENLAAAYSRAADYVAITARQLNGDRDFGDPGQAEKAATAAVHQLDDAFRQYLTERSAARTDPGSDAALVAGAARLLRAGHSMAALSTMTTGGGPGAGEEHGVGAESGGGDVPGAGDEHGVGAESGGGDVRGAGDEHGTDLGWYRDSMDAQIQTVRSWYVTLGDSLAHGTSVPPSQPPDPGSRRQLLQYVRECVATGDEPALRRALLVLWASQHLDLLRRMEAHLSDHAAAASVPPSTRRPRPEVARSHDAAR